MCYLTDAVAKGKHAHVHPSHLLLSLAFRSLQAPPSLPGIHSTLLLHHSSFLCVPKRERESTFEFLRQYFLYLLKSLATKSFSYNIFAFFKSRRGRVEFAFALPFASLSLSLHRCCDPKL